MKLSWKDVITTLLAVGGGALVYAKFYEYTWAMIASWRSAVMVLAGLGIGMLAFSGVNFVSRSALNIGEVTLGIAALALAITGAFVTSQLVFYSLAGVLGILWLGDFSSHAWHSLMDEETASFQHHVHVH